MSVSIAVVVCVYTEARLPTIELGVHVALTQATDGDEVILVVDHNPALQQRLEELFPRVTVLANSGARGLSGGRNTGVRAARADVVVFLDDDAIPRPGWLAAYRERFADPGVLAAGGAVEPDWAGEAPAWFPPEYGWVVGCDYVGLPAHGAPIRNPIGANMAVRRAALETAGGFSELFGRVGSLPVGCEETEMSIRLSAANPGSRIVRETRAVVDHSVTTDRTALVYFLRRCFHEGRSKALISRSVGSSAGLSSERRFVVRVLGGAFIRHVASAVRGDVAGLARATLVCVGLTATITGYLVAAATSAAATTPERGPVQPGVPVRS